MAGPLVVLAGPTAAGKSALALAWAERFGFEIVSADSALVYRGMDIGTDKPPVAVRDRVPHHLIDVRDPAEPYSAAEFAADARRAIEDIERRGRRPLVVGGTFLYLRALLHGLSTLPAAQPALRAALKARLAEQGSAALHAELAAVDPDWAARVHPNDPQRILRALEVHHSSGVPLSRLAAARPGRALDRPVLALALWPEDRAALHRRIAARFDRMLEAGFLDEVAALRARGDLSLDTPAMRAVGYRQAWLHLDGVWDRDTFRARALAATRQLAKRQLTWLRGDPQWIRLPAENLSADDGSDRIARFLGA